jgi:hypothetical protein
MLVNVRSGGTVRVKGDEGVPPGFVALTLTGPGVCMRLGGTVSPTGEETGPRLVPFQESVIPCWKPEPFTYKNLLAKSPVAVFQL